MTQRNKSSSVKPVLVVSCNPFLLIEVVDVQQNHWSYYTPACVERLESKSRGGAKYFLTFVDYNSRYAWVYPLQTKYQVFQQFVEWKVLVESSSGNKLQTLRSDNGGEFTSTQSEHFLTKEGIRHE